MRLGFDLGLHIDCTPYVRPGLLTAADARARYSTFWSCVVVNEYKLSHLEGMHEADVISQFIKHPLGETFPHRQ